MRGEFGALRKVARLAADYVATLSPTDGGADPTTLQDLRAALDDLSGELHALINDG